MPFRYAAAIVGAVRLLSVALAASLMDRAGRKVLLYTSSMLMFLSSLTFTMYSHVTPCLTPPSPHNLTHYTHHVYDSLVTPPEPSLVPLFVTIVFIFGEFITQALVCLGPSTGIKNRTRLMLKLRYCFVKFM